MIRVADYVWRFIHVVRKKAGGKSESYAIKRGVMTGV